MVDGINKVFFTPFPGRPVQANARPRETLYEFTRSPAGSSRWAFFSIRLRVTRLIVLTSPISFSTGYLIVFVTAYLPQIGIGSEAIGLMLGANGFAMILSAIPLGLLSDRWGRKWILLAGALAVPPSLLVFALTTDVFYLVLANVVMGVADGAFLSTWNAIIADQTTAEQRDAAFSLCFILGNVTTGVGFAIPLSFPLLEAWTGLSSSAVHVGAMTLASVFAVLTPLFAWLLLRDYVEGRQVKAKAARTMRWGPSSRSLG